LFYSIKENVTDPVVITALSVDGRTISMELFNKEHALPINYDIIFLLHTEDLQGQADIDRRGLTIPESTSNALKRLFAYEVAQILSSKLPIIAEKNAEVRESLQKTFPHLTGYFTAPAIGIMSSDAVLKIAQDKFFLAQKEILEAEELSEEQYAKSLEISARVLMEYVLHRSILINKLKSMSEVNDEKDIHDIIVPARSTYHSDTFAHDIYSNNAWLLDDRYMSYTTILSDRDMGNLLDAIKVESEDDLAGKGARPDIAIVFSEDPQNAEGKVDVVIIELKKLGLALKDKENVESQLRQRARKLLAYLPNKIQRIWFYGLVDFDDEFVQSLEELEYIELFGKGRVFYKEVPIDVFRDGVKTPASIFIQSFDTFLKEAEHRNATFLRVLKESFKTALNS